MTGRCSNQLNYSRSSDGRNWTRTNDRLCVRQELYQLSYTPEKEALIYRVVEFSSRPFLFFLFLVIFSPLSYTLTNSVSEGNMALAPSAQKSKSLGGVVLGYLWIAIGAFLAAFAIEVFLIPKNLIDGGIIGVAMICSYVFGKGTLPVFLAVFSAPFVVLAYRYIGKIFLFHMLFALGCFVTCIFTIQHAIPISFDGESLEVVVIGGAILGIGIGLIIRYGGCLDGTEILGIILNQTLGITVGQVVLLCNVFIFSAAGLIFNDWHPAILSLITFMVATKVMDAVIVGLEETKSVWIISPKSAAISKAIIHELGLGVTILYGKGGYSGTPREILYVIAERLQLAELKELVYREDPSAFMAIENIHEVANGTQGDAASGKQKRIETLIAKVFGSK